MPTYSVETHLRTGELVAKIPWRNLQFERSLNNPSGIRCEVPLYHSLVRQDTIAAGLHELWVRRNGTVVAAGPLWDVIPSTESKSMSLSAMSLEDYLDVRIVGDQTYNLVDQTSIAWGLINTTQTAPQGGLGIVQGTLNTGVTRSLVYKEYEGKQVLEAITDLSELTDGFDFYIDPSTRAFNARYPRMQRDLGLVLKYPEHLSGYAVQYWGKYMRNRVMIQGPEPFKFIADHPASRATYGLRELADSYKDAPTTTIGNAFASKIRDMRSEVKAYPSIVLRSGMFNWSDPNWLQFGDKVKIVINDGYVNLNTQMRFGGCQVSVRKNGTESVVLYMQDLRELT